MITMVTGEDRIQPWLLVLALWELQGWPETKTPMLFLLLLQNTSKGQTGEELQVLLLVWGTLFCYIVHHGLSFGQLCTYPIP